MINAQKLRESNDPNWWKIHESCLLAVSTLKPYLQELTDSNQLEFNLNAFFNQFVVACLHESSINFFHPLILFKSPNEKILKF
jgi:hypothetical protein